jgi:hypothetical protein
MGSWYRRSARLMPSAFVNVSDTSGLERKARQLGAVVLARVHTFFEALGKIWLDAYLTPRVSSRRIKWLRHAQSSDIESRRDL